MDAAEKRQTYRQLAQRGLQFEAAEYRERVRLELRDKGVPKAEAAAQAWTAVAERFLGDDPCQDGQQHADEPLDVGPEASALVCEAAAQMLARWCDCHRVAIPVGADIELVAEMAYFWATGLLGQVPNAGGVCVMAEGEGIQDPRCRHYDDIFFARG